MSLCKHCYGKPVVTANPLDFADCVSCLGRTLLNTDLLCFQCAITLERCQVCGLGLKEESQVKDSTQIEITETENSWRCNIS